jgi:hypothetical protein
VPFKLTFFERQIFLKQNWGPGPILDLFGALAFKAVAAAVRLDLFETLESLGPLTARSLAETLDADERGVMLLLDTLVNMGYLQRTGKMRYGNAPMARSWMLKKSPFNLADMVGYFEDASERWGYLDKSIRSGRPAELCDAWLNRHPGSWERYHAGMYGIAQLVAPEIVSRVKLPASAKRMIDIGGSHGLYSVKFCQRNPGLSAVVFDWKQARRSAEDTIRRHGMEKRVCFVEGDFNTGDFGTGYDAALLFNVVRIYPEPEAVALLKKVRASLNPGGRLLIADQFNTRMPTDFVRANVLLVLLELYNGCLARTYTAAEVQAMLVKAGFSKSKEILLNRAPGISIVAAENGGK